ncbi:MAG: hypothetical protein EZS28_021125 [Streblomastix strix]|uniref:Uncharacterized protein n=1 Tax=Streblomastix strix TaxID=222440 RepID=A0A5J4VLK8_9EUKA|nr:MAG: hypothetical protein EZS28_021125 [Streblomastix strix]
MIASSGIHLATIDDVVDKITQTTRQLFLEKDNAALHIQQMGNYLRLADMKSALYHCRKAFQLDQKPETKGIIALMLDLLGLISTRAGKLEEAESYFSQSVDLSPLSWSFWAHYAIPALQKDDYDSAMDRTSRALELCSRKNSLPLLMIQAQIYLNRGEQQLAKEICEEALQLDDQYPGAVKFMQV